MNPLNYASPEASKRLAEAGILLETEAVWRLSGANETYFLQTGGSSPSLLIPWGDFPAPCMAEVWRELPFGDWELYQLIRKYLMFRGLDFEDYSVAMELIRIARSADALIDLLIWVRKEADHAD